MLSLRTCISNRQMDIAEPPLRALKKTSPLPLSFKYFYPKQKSTKSKMVPKLQSFSIRKFFPTKMLKILAPKFGGLCFKQSVSKTLIVRLAYRVFIRYCVFRRFEYVYILHAALGQSVSMFTRPYAASHRCQ